MESDLHSNCIVSLIQTLSEHPLSPIILMRPLAGTHSNVQETHTNDFRFVHTTGRFVIPINYKLLLCVSITIQRTSSSQLQFHLACGPTKTSKMSLAKIYLQHFDHTRVIFFRQLRRLPECDRNIANFFLPTTVNLRDPLLNTVAHGDMMTKELPP